jgi:hypothetical protein
MPQQETLFEQETGDGRIEILKVYDRVYAQEAFENMDEASQKFLWNSLGINEKYDVADVPPIDDPASEDFLWEELLDAARHTRRNRSRHPVHAVASARPGRAIRAKGLLGKRPACQA